jgi:site-specific DNA recombinase
LQAILDQAADRMSLLRLAETLTAFLQRLHESAQSLEIVDRQKIVRLLVKDILVDNDTIAIRHSIPSHPRTPPPGTEPPSDGKSQMEGEGYLLRSGSERAALRRMHGDGRVDEVASQRPEPRQDTILARPG